MVSQNLRIFVEAVIDCNFLCIYKKLVVFQNCLVISQAKLKKKKNAVRKYSCLLLL